MTETAPPAEEVRLTDPRALRGLAHPLRMRLVGLLRTHGSLTATQAAALLGESSGSCSFHLRQLAKYGLVEEVTGPGRAKPWRATARATTWEDDPADPAQAAAARVLTGVQSDRYAEVIREWLDRRDGEPPEWRRAAWLGDQILHLTAEELTRLSGEIDRLLAPYSARVYDPDVRPEGSRLVTIIAAAFPTAPVSPAEQPR